MTSSAAPASSPRCMSSLAAPSKDVLSYSCATSFWNDLVPMLISLNQLAKMWHEVYALDCKALMAFTCSGRAAAQQLLTDLHAGTEVSSRAARAGAQLQRAGGPVGPGSADCAHAPGRFAQSPYQLGWPHGVPGCKSCLQCDFEHARTRDESSTEACGTHDLLLTKQEVACHC